MKIGKLVKNHIQGICDHCNAVEHEEICRLSDPNYSKKTFDLNFPFYKEIDKIEPKESKRYWREIYTLGNKPVRVTSQWFNESAPLFIKYLQSKNIDLKAIPPENKISTDSKSNLRNRRYGSYAIGNAQNQFIRNILSNIEYESFDEKDWNETKSYFLDKCAYCGAEDKLEIDHAIPINRKNLGEHRLGNLIPSCNTCNSKKSNMDFREFLGGDDEKINTILSYMNSKEYNPIEDNEQIRNILNIAHNEVSALASRYIEIINNIIQKPNRTPKQPSFD